MVISPRWQDDKIISVPSRNHLNIFLAVLLHILRPKQKNLSGQQFDKNIESNSLWKEQYKRQYCIFLDDERKLSVNEFFKKFGQGDLCL